MYLSGVNGSLPDWPIAGYIPVDVDAIPTPNQQARMNMNRFAIIYAQQQHIDGVFTIMPSNQIHLKVTEKTPTLLNVYPAKYVPWEVLEVPSDLYQKAISDSAAITKIVASAPIDKTLLRVLGIDDEY